MVASSARSCANTRVPEWNPEGYNPRDTSELKKIRETLFSGHFFKLKGQLSDPRAAVSAHTTSAVTCLDGPEWAGSFERRDQEGGQLGVLGEVEPIYTHSHTYKHTPGGQ